MLDQMAIALVLDLVHGSRDQRSPAAEDEFYRSVGRSRLVHIAAHLLSMPVATWGRRWQAPSSSLSEAKRTIRQRSACDPALQRGRHQCGITGSAP